MIGIHKKKSARGSSDAEIVKNKKSHLSDLYNIETPKEKRHPNGEFVTFE